MLIFMVLSPWERKKTIALIDTEINFWKFYQRCLSSTSSTGKIFKIIYQYLPSLINFHSHGSSFLHPLKMQMFPKFKSPERMAAKLWKFDHQHFTLKPTNGEIFSSTRQHLPFFFNFQFVAFEERRITDTIHFQRFTGVDIWKRQSKRPNRQKERSASSINLPSTIQ